MADLIFLGLIITLEPLPVTGYIVLLGSEHGIGKGLAFICGWLGSLVGVVVLTLVATGGKPLRSGTAPSTAVSVATLLIGLLLLAVGYRQRRHTDKPPGKPPKWMERVDRLSIWSAMGLGLLLQPWPLVAAGVASITDADLSATSSVVYLVLFCVLSTSSLAAMQIYAMSTPERAMAQLNALRTWVNDHRHQAIMWLAILAGLWLVGKAVYELV